MRQIAPDVYMMEGIRRANVYLLTSREGVTLVDTGIAGDADRIVAQLEEGGYTLSDLRAIVLTHCHGDHTGSAAELAQRSGAQILAHRDDVPYIEQTKSLPDGPFLRRLLNWLSDQFFKTAPCKVNRVLLDGDTIEALGGMHVFHLPGHTPGSIVLYQPGRRILFCGDVLFNANPLSGKEGLQLPPRVFSLDVAQAEESARKLADLPVDVLCSGHGDPILERAGEKIRGAVE
jgi:glyoxylase-like metal-dependent hydrolase (beta-lactamase superfamily II)